MKYLKWLILLYSLGAMTLEVSAQKEHFKKVGETDLKAEGIEVDKLGNLYAFRKEKIIKLTPGGVEMRSDSYNRFGKIHSIDVSNPLKILVFFEEMLQIIFVDNELARRGDVVQLDFMGFPQVVSACMSYNNGFWVFDQSTFKLTRLAERMTETNSTSNLLQITGSEINPVKMFESNKKLYLADPAQGVFIFDVFGTFYRKIPVKNIRSIDYFGEYVYLLTDKEIAVYNEKTSETEFYPAPVQNADYLAVHKSKIYILHNNKLLFFTVNL